MKKVLHLTISSEIGGGPEHIYQLISGLSTDIESHVACPALGPYYNKFSEITFGRVTFLPHRKFKLSALFSLSQYIKKNNIDLLHGHGKGAGLYCRMLRLFFSIPVVHTPHGINQQIEGGIINSLYIQFERLFSFLIEAIIFVSESEYNYARNLNIWPKTPSQVIHNGTISISNHQKSLWREEARYELGISNKKVIISASRFDYQKNSLELCEIASLSPIYIFIILGDGDQRKFCEQFCKINSVTNILFMGNVLDPLKYFSAADIYLSTSRWEGLSMAILESMSLGLPVLATNVVGNVDLVKVGETGFLYTLGNISEATRYLDLLVDALQYGNIQEAAIEYHKQEFSSEIMCSQTLSVYNKLLAIYV
jgi:glycosyltransferase involved in cell wall biosynthesis